MNTDIIAGCPFCDCGTLMVCLDGYSFICPNPECFKKSRDKTRGKDEIQD